MEEEKRRRRRSIRGPRLKRISGVAFSENCRYYQSPPIQEKEKENKYIKVKRKKEKLYCLFNIIMVIIISVIKEA